MGEGTVFYCTIQGGGYKRQDYLGRFKNGLCMGEDAGID